VITDVDELDFVEDVFSGSFSTLTTMLLPVGLMPWNEQNHCQLQYTMLVCNL
jgi:hypothetical protein